MNNLKKLEKLLFSLCLLTLPSQIGKHFWPKFSLIFSLPIDYFSPVIYGWDILVCSLLIVWIIPNFKRKLNIKAFNLFLIFMLSLLPSLFVTSNLGAGLVRFEQLMLAGLFGIYISNQKLSEIKRLIYICLMVDLFYESLLAIGEFLLSRSLNLWIIGERSFDISTTLIAKFDFRGQVFLRPYASFPHPNVLAAFIVTLIPIVWFLANEYLKKSLLVLVISSFATLLTFSRAAIAVLIIQCLYALRKNLKILTLAVIFLSPILWVRYNSAFNFDSLSLIRREELAQIALQDFYHSPAFGIGLNNFINQTASSNLISGPNRFLQPVHNIFLLQLSETGLIGFLGFLSLIFIPIKFLWNSKKSNWSKVLLAAWSSIIFLGLFDHYFLTLAQGQRLFFFIWGLSMLEYFSGSFKNHR